MTYTVEQKAEALIRLAINHYDFHKTCKELEIPHTTLHRWAKQVPTREVNDLLERAVSRMLMAIPANWSGKDWAIAVGILLDKLLLFRGQPTARTESIIKDLDSLADEERREVVENARRIIEGLSRAGADSGEQRHETEILG